MTIKYRKVKTEEQIPVRIICNKCGKAVNLNKELGDGFTTIVNIYGYGSGKDRDKYESHICESCMDAFYKTFKTPPSVVEAPFYLRWE